MPEIVAPTVVEPTVDVTETKPLAEDDPTLGNENIVTGPANKECVENTAEKKMAKIVKEGGKRGVEIEGAADMGGLQFFCTMMGEELTAGKVDLLVESMKAMNAVSDPTEEERKGGAGKLGKMIFSFNEASLSAVAYVPKDKADECSAKEWLSDVVLNISNAACVAKIQTFEESDGIDSKYYAAIQINKEGDLFPIKMRDPAISMAYNYLKKKGLFPDDDEEDDEEYVFGDDDFP